MCWTTDGHPDGPKEFEQLPKLTFSNSHCIISTEVCFTVFVLDFSISVESICSISSVHPVQYLFLHCHSHFKLARGHRGVGVAQARGSLSSTAGQPQGHLHQQPKYPQTPIFDQKKEKKRRGMAWHYTR